MLIEVLIKHFQSKGQILTANNYEHSWSWVGPSSELAIYSFPSLSGADTWYCTPSCGSSCVGIDLWTSFVSLSWRSEYLFMVTCAHITLNWTLSVKHFLALLSTMKPRAGTGGTGGCILIGQVCWPLGQTTLSCDWRSGVYSLVSSHSPQNLKRTCSQLAKFHMCRSQQSLFLGDSSITITSVSSKANRKWGIDEEPKKWLHQRA